MQRLKEFCTDSIVLVIYHFDADVKKVTDGKQDEKDECVHGSNFFDANLHVKDGSLLLRSVCNSKNE